MASRVTSTSTTLVHSKVDLTVWIEVCELAPDGQYLPVVVDHYDDTPCKGTFLLHQGIQRRIRVTIMNHPDFDVPFKDLRELVIGRVRTYPDCSDFDDENDLSVLSLSLFFSEHLDSLEDGRSVFRFEAAWDTSLHNSLLLNRVTPSGERVYLTMSAYLDLEHCSQPAILTKDLCLIIYGRDSRTYPLLSHAGLSTRVLKHLLTGSYKNAEYNHIMAIFELVLRRSLEATNPGVQRRQRRVLDTSTMYVRGQENLGGWQPRGDSLIFDHQWELEKLCRLEMVERTRHLLLIRAAKITINRQKKETVDTLEEDKDEDEVSEIDDFYDYVPTPSYEIKSGMRTSASRLSLAAIANSNSATTTPTPPTTSATPVTATSTSTTSFANAGRTIPKSSTFSSGIQSLERLAIDEFRSERDRELCAKCTNLIRFNIPSKPAPSLPNESLLKIPDSGLRSSGFMLGCDVCSNASTPEMASPEKVNWASGVGSWFEKEKASFDGSNNNPGGGICGSCSSTSGVVTASASTNELAMFVPEIEEVRVSSVVSKKGYLSLLMASEQVKVESTRWTKQWIVVRRPYLFIYKDDKDPVERSVINLANARVECSEQQNAMLCVENAFSVVTKHAGYLFRTSSLREMYDWLYSINPLYAGQLMCQWARQHHQTQLAAAAAAATEENQSGSGSDSSTPQVTGERSFYQQITSESNNNDNSCSILQ